MSPSMSSFSVESLHCRVLSQLRLAGHFYFEAIVNGICSWLFSPHLWLASRKTTVDFLFSTLKRVFLISQKCRWVFRAALCTAISCANEDTWTSSSPLRVLLFVSLSCANKTLVLDSVREQNGHLV